MSVIRDELGPLYGYGIARRIEQISGDRLEQEGAIASEWRPSENNRRARFFEVKAGDLA